MTCHGRFSLEESVRRTWYNPELILNAAGLSRGMVFADIGCGDGFFSILAAEIVGELGRVYALDIDASAIEKLGVRAVERGLTNIRASVGAAEETVICKECVDIVFLSMVLHDFDDPKKVLLNAKQMLKRGGLLVNLDWKKKQMDFGPPVNIRFSEEKTIELLNRAGFTVEKAKDAGPYHYIITAKLTS
jgi:ubiquinone/menaquinone biosynthesis C-methylase UbiE